MPLTVGELRKAMEGLPDDYPVEVVESFGDYEITTDGITEPQGGGTLFINVTVEDLIEEDLDDFDDDGIDEGEEDE